VCSNPARNVYSNGGDFSALGVYASQTFDPEGVDTEVSHGPNQDFFQVAHVTMHVFAIGTEIDDWITDYLAQSVISHLSATIGFKQSHVSRVELFLIE